LAFRVTEAGTEFSADQGEKEFRAASFFKHLAAVREAGAGKADLIGILYLID
jgi:hypothetical protein